MAASLHVPASWCLRRWFPTNEANPCAFAERRRDKCHLTLLLSCVYASMSKRDSTKTPLRRVLAALGRSPFCLTDMGRYSRDNLCRGPARDLLRLHPPLRSRPCRERSLAPSSLAAPNVHVPQPPTRSRAVSTPWARETRCPRPDTASLRKSGEAMRTALPLGVPAGCSRRRRRRRRLPLPRAPALARPSTGAAREKPAEQARVGGAPTVGAEGMGLR